jgi:hypothetical protein
MRGFAAFDVLDRLDNVTTGKEKSRFNYSTRLLLRLLGSPRLDAPREVAEGKPEFLPENFELPSALLRPPPSPILPLSF